MKPMFFFGLIFVATVKKQPRAWKKKITLRPKRTYLFLIFHQYTKRKINSDTVTFKKNTKKHTLSFAG